jgi:hypothetical protein
MGLLRGRRNDEPVDMNERSPQLGVRYKDLLVMHQLVKNGADLSESRHVLYYSFAPSEDVAKAMGSEAESRGFATVVSDPLPDFPGQWSLTCETNAVMSPDFVRASDDFFQGLADRHGAEYDGWEASV